MTHLERFSRLQKTVLFDYLERNPLTQDARICLIDSLADCGENRCKAQKKRVKYKRKTHREEGRNMNFNDKRVKKAVAVIIMIVIVAMVATMILPAMV